MLRPAVRVLAAGQDHRGGGHRVPDGGAAGDTGLGPGDLFGISEPEIQLVIAINPRRRSVRWSTNRNGALSGTLAGHHFRIAGYHVLPRPDAAKTKRKKGRPSKKDRPRLVRARVYCPYAVGLNPGGVARFGDAAGSLSPGGRGSG